jgi:hypothetical protein
LQEIPPVGASLLAKAVYAQNGWRLTLRLREQARSHRVLWRIRNPFKNDLYLYRKRYSGTISLHPPVTSAAQRFDPIKLFSSPQAVAISLQAQTADTHLKNPSH